MANPLGINPILIDFGILQVRWYGVMYVIGFLVAQFLATYLIKKRFFRIELKQLDSLLTLMFALMFVGARTAYVFIYNWEYYRSHLLEGVMLWKGGLSFHGALVGLIAAGILFAKKNKLHWIEVMDVVALAGCQGIFFGRLGNFINGELYGRVTDSSFGLVFPNGGPFPRHASQLYEAVLEGVVLTLILWIVHARSKRFGNVSLAFLLGYGVFRFVVEFFRQPDDQLGYYFGGITMGQILCFLMIFAGFFLWVQVRKWNLTYHPSST